MEINFLQVLFQAFNFGVILFVLNKFLYKPIRKILEARETKINEGLKAAEKNLKAEADLEDTKKEALTKARREASKIIADATKDAQAQADEIIKAAKLKAGKEVESMLKSARSSADEAEKKMAESLKELTVSTTKKLLADSLSAKEVQAITNSMIKKLK